jgi:hypothetical protein
MSTGRNTAETLRSKVENFPAGTVTAQHLQRIRNTPAMPSSEIRLFWPHFGDATGFPAITIALTLVLATALMWLS